MVLKLISGTVGSLCFYSLYNPPYIFTIHIKIPTNLIVGVMVRMFTLNVGSRPGLIKDFEIDNYCFTTKYSALNQKHLISLSGRHVH